ncbi:MAG: Radical SAM superfamily protein [bacterium ADurb.Bin243]|nr:MAG: Radical SAM superfamily protein [bacterium ADurb.Bin243]HOD40169.1 radical SAM protein [Candidatus Wallbacteria bacterium]
MKILFVDPPHKPWEFFPGIMPSPGLLAIIPSAREFAAPDGISVLDLSLEIDPVKSLAAACKNFAPDVIAISGAKSAFAYETLNTAALCRKYSPRSIIAGGGNFLSSYAAEVIGRGYFDVIAAGEGEKVFAGLLSAVKENRISALADLRGIAYCKEFAARGRGFYKTLKEIFAGSGKFSGFNCGEGLFDRAEIFKTIFTPPMPQIENLDELQIPAFEYFDMDLYTLPPLGGSVGFVVSFSRGCVKKCSFCADSAFWGHKWRGFSAKRCLEILKILYNAYGRRVFYFGDSDFWQDRSRNIEFLELLEFEKKRGFEINFWIQSSAANILSNADLLKRYRACGLYQIMCGFESVSGRVQKSFKKIISTDTMRSVSALMKKNGVLLMGMMMWGDRSDTEETLRENLDFMVKHCDVIGPNTMLAHYGTRYFEERSGAHGVDKFKVLQNDQCEIIFPTETLDVRQAASIYRDLVLKTLISRKKFIGNYLSAKNARTKAVMAELTSRGFAVRGGVS